MGRCDAMSNEEEIEAMLRWGDRLVDGRESFKQYAGATPDQQSPKANLATSFTPVRGRRGDSNSVGKREESADQKASKIKKKINTKCQEAETKGT